MKEYPNVYKKLCSPLTNPHFNLCSCPTLKKPSAYRHPLFSEHLIRVVSDRCCYNHVTGLISLPPKRNFFKEEYYYLCLFHEVAHATSINRKKTRTNLEDEIIAELVSAVMLEKVGMLDEDSVRVIQIPLNDYGIDIDDLSEDIKTEIDRVLGILLPRLPQRSE